MIKHHNSNLWHTSGYPEIGSVFEFKINGEYKSKWGYYIPNKLELIGYMIQFCIENKISFKKPRKSIVDYFSYLKEKIERYD
jgi:hypothetical protein